MLTPALLFWCKLACTTAAAAPRVVAVGDLHGDLGATMSVLQLAGVVDVAGRWIGGDAVLVQTGDTTDRGADTRAVLDLFLRLETEAAQAGGRVVLLLGNHEVMNVLGDWRYVHPDDLGSFGGAEARATAFSPAGVYGGWLVRHDAVAIVDGTVFVHGGLTPEWARMGIDTINSQVRDGLIVQPTSALGAEGPLWVRTLVEGDEASACADVAASLAAVGARRMVVGHTTRRDGKVQVRCEGRLAVIDTGISAAYGNHLSVWESIEGDARVRYPSGTVDVVDPP